MVQIKPPLVGYGQVGGLGAPGWHTLIEDGVCCKDRFRSGAAHQRPLSSPLAP